MTVSSVLGELKRPELWKFVGLVVAALIVSVYLNKYLRAAGVPIVA